MAFQFRKSRNPNGGRELVEYTFDDSATFTVGDALKFDVAGKLVLWGQGGAGLGILVEVHKANGAPVTDNGSGGDYVGTYTTPASNTVVGVVDASIESVYSVTADDTLGNTTGSDLPGYNMDCNTASDQIDENASTQAPGTTASFFSWGQDPDPTAADNSVLVSIQESQVKI